MGQGLIAIGIALILISAASVYMVFTGRANPYPLFDFPPIGFGADQLLNTQTVPKQLVSQEKVELISSDLLNNTSNITAHLFLMGFLASIGGRLANIGTMLVRPISVKLQETK